MSGTSHEFQAALTKAIEERDRLNALIALLSEQLGVAPPIAANGTSDRSGLAPTTPGADPVAGTTEGQYFGQTSTDAALEVLTRFGSTERPLKTAVLFEAIKKGGVAISSEQSLYRSLARSRRFRKVARGTWGLSEWYPNAKSPGQRPAAEPDAVDDDPVPGGDDQVPSGSDTSVDPPGAEPYEGGGASE